ncbi:MAG: LysE family transporter [Flavobacteriales bacterium]|nr:LysE family transporter [Flavobacteriales bacterium]
MDALILFFIAAIASFVGSLQAGLVNTAVLAHTIQRGPEAGRRMAIGGAIPELLYAALAFQFASWVLHRLGLGTAGIGLLVGSVLIVIGLYFLVVFKPKFDAEAVKIKASGVRKGLLLGLANPQLLLFWCGVKLSLSSFGVEEEGWLGLLAFALGAFVGALVLLLQLVKLGKRAVDKLKPRTLQWMFRAVGMVLVVSGIVGIMRTRTPPSATNPASSRSMPHSASQAHARSKADGLLAAVAG